MPPKDTPLYNFMANHEKKWTGPFLPTKEGFWSTCLEVDPVASGAINPAKWYLSELRIFTWMPPQQFSTVIDKSKLHCIHGDCPSRQKMYTGSCTIKSHGSKCW